MNMAKLDVLYQFDENYAAIGGVSITTLFKNNTDIEELTVYLAAKDVSEDNKKKLDALAKHYRRKIVYLNVDSIYPQLEKLGARTWNGSLAVWMKIFVVSEIPTTVDRLLYIDSDTLIQGSLRDLTEIDLGDYMMGAVIDSIARKNVVRLNLDNPCYNSGVMLFNLRLWREKDTENDMLHYLRHHVTEYLSPDQDFVNDYFRGRIMDLGPKYNFQGLHFFFSDKVYFRSTSSMPGAYYSPEEIKAARDSVAIVHFFRFCGQYPWEPSNIHGCKKMFEKALDESLWKGHKFAKKDLPISFRIEKALYKMLPQRLFMFLYIKTQNI